MKNRTNKLICLSTLVMSFISVGLIPFAMHSGVMLIDSNTLSIKSSFGGEVFMPIVIWLFGCFILTVRSADDLIFRKGPRIAFTVILTLNFIVVMATKIVF